MACVTLAKQLIIPSLQYAHPFWKSVISEPQDALLLVNMPVAKSTFGALWIDWCMSLLLCAGKGNVSRAVWPCMPCHTYKSCILSLSNRYHLGGETRHFPAAGRRLCIGLLGLGPNMAAAAAAQHSRDRAWWPVPPNPFYKEQRNFKKLTFELDSIRIVGYSFLSILFLAI